MYFKINNNQFDCNQCTNRCDGKSKGIYDFEKDVAFSEEIENQIIKKINSDNPNLFAYKTKKPGYPDIEIISKESVKKPIAYIEVKVQARTFMSIQKFLPNCNLLPSETLALNLSDLERYFKIAKDEQANIYILWCLKNRNCINQNKSESTFYQNLNILQKIRTQDTNNSRKFKRSTGIGDVVDGIHKGVLVNYHFSINELEIGLPLLKF